MFQRQILCVGPKLAIWQSCNRMESHHWFEKKRESIQSVRDYRWETHICQRACIE